MTGERAGPLLHVAGPDGAARRRAGGHAQGAGRHLREHDAAGASMTGKVQALPIEIDISPMFARKDLLAKVGLPIPQTWEELRAAAQGDPEGRPDHPGRLAFRSRAPTTPRARSARSSGRSAAPCSPKDGKTVTFNSPESDAAYQFIADMFAEGTHSARRALLGRCRQQQRLPDRPCRLHHQSAERLCVDAGQRQDAAQQHRAHQPAQGPGSPKGASRQHRLLALARAEELEADRPCQGLAPLLLRADALPADHREGGRTLGPDLSRR